MIKRQGFDVTICSQAEKFLNRQCMCCSLCPIFSFNALIELGFNDTSTLVGHFVSTPREREKKDRRGSRGDEREGQGRKRNRNESEECVVTLLISTNNKCFHEEIRRNINTFCLQVMFSVCNPERY